MKSWQFTLEHLLNQYEKNIMDVLRSAGYLKKKGKFNESFYNEPLKILSDRDKRKLEHAQARGKNADIEKYTQKAHVRLTCLNGALLRIHEVRENVKAGNAEAAALASIYMVIRANNADLVILREHIDRGVKAVKGASEGGNARVGASKNNWDLWQEMADDVWKKYPSYSKIRVAKMVRDKLIDDDEQKRAIRTIREKIIK